MRILGLDPGTATTGFGFIDVIGDTFKVGTWGLVETEKTELKEKRLEQIYQRILTLIKEGSPDVVVIEKVFFATNAKTAIAVGQAQGVMLLAASKTKKKVFEYAPGTIKKVITGSGRAKKKDIQRNIRKLLGKHIKSAAHKKTHFDNAADALAIALTHASTLGIKLDIS